MADDVLIGLDGWLFLKGGSNHPFDYYHNILEFDKGLVDAWQRLLRGRVERMKGRTYLHLFVPNKETVYEDKTGLTPPKHPGNPLQAMARKASEAQRAALEDICVVPINYFKRIKKDYQLYWKTDSHWNYNGCYAAYQLICSRLNIPPVRDLLGRPYTEGVIAMDLGGKIVPAVTETARYYDFCQNATCSAANALVAFKQVHNLENEARLHVGSSVVYTNANAPVKKKVALFGDSFSEYRPVLLTGMLAETFSETHFVWSTSLDYAYIDAANPDIVITEIAERFMPLVPEDTFELDAYVSNSIEKFKKNP